MKNKELLLKTIFCCMACDGSIAPEEVKYVEDAVGNNPTLFKGMDVNAAIKYYVEEINRMGNGFLLNYLSSISSAELSPDDEMAIVKTALEVIKSDQVIEYSEVSFFKKIRKRINLSDEAILAELPDVEDFLLPDIATREDYDFNFTFWPFEVPSSDGTHTMEQS